MKKAILVILFFCVPSFLLAQQTEIDSLEKLLSKNPMDTLKIKLMLDLTRKYQNISIEKSMDYTKKALFISQKSKQETFIALSYQRLGAIFWLKGTLDESISYYQKALSIFQKKHDKKNEAACLIDLATTYVDLGSAQMAIDYYQKALFLSKKLHDSRSYTRCLNNVGWQTALLHNYDSAYWYFQQAIPLAKKEHPDFLPYLYDNMGEVLMMEKRINEAEIYLKKSLKLSHEFKNKRIELVVYRVLAEIDLEHNLVDAAEFKAKKSLELALELQAKQKIFQAYDVLSKISFIKKDFEKAYNYKNLYITYKDSVQSQKAKNALQAFEYERKKGEIFHLKALNEQAKIQKLWIIIFSVVACIVLVMIILIVYFNHKKVQNAYTNLEKANNEILQRNEEIIQQKEELQQLLQALQQTQAQLVQSEKSAVLGLVMATISHEINNPINYVKAGSQVLKENINDLIQFFEKTEDIFCDNIKNLYEEMQIRTINKDISNLVGDIEEGADRTIEIIQNLKMFIRLDEQGFKNVNLSQSFSSVLVVLRNRFLGKIEIITDFDKDLPNIYCDISKINHLFLGLLLNASEAIPKKGIITIKTYQNEYYVIFSVADNGIGISDSMKNHIFNPFTTTKEKGTGLGLYIAKEIIAEHKGKIEFDTSEQGTIFTIFLPKNFKNH